MIEIPDFVFHGTTAQIERLEDFAPSADGGFHFGTLEQAQMRSMGGGRRILRARIEVGNPVRLRDEGGGWKAKIAWARAAGHDAIVYLNRYEGVSTESVMANAGIGLDRLTDPQFRIRVPEARDSWILFGREQLLGLEEVEAEPRRGPRP